MAQNAPRPKSEAPSGRTPVSLTQDQLSTLRVLGYLFIRMGHYDRAKVLFDALIVLNPNDRWARRNLAAIVLALGDAKTALEHLRVAVGDGLLSTRDAALHLLRAQALRQAGRADEAQSAVDAYLTACGKKTSPGSALSSGIRS